MRGWRGTWLVVLAVIVMLPVSAAMALWDALRRAARWLRRLMDCGPGECPHGVPMVDDCQECGR